MTRKEKTRMLTLTGMVAALYVLLTMINPISYGFIQFRISEIICVMPFINKKFIPGCIIGGIVANAFSSLGFIDVIFGLIIGIVAYYIIIKIENPYVCSVLFSLTSGVFVSLELYIVGSVPIWLSLLSVTVSQMVITLIAVPIDRKIIGQLIKKNLL